MDNRLNLDIFSSISFSLRQFIHLEDAEQAQFSKEILNGEEERYNDWFNNLKKTNNNAIRSDMNIQFDKYLDSSALYIKTTAEIESLFSYLQTLKPKASPLFLKLKNLINEASRKISEYRRQEIITECNTIIADIAIIGTNTIASNIKAFDASVLVVHQRRPQEGDRIFDLPILNTKSIGIINDNVLTQADALKAVASIETALRRSSIWVLTGIYDATYSVD